MTNDIEESTNSRILTHKSNKQVSATTHHFFYINNKFEFALFRRGETEQSKILELLYQDRDFQSMRENIYPEWKNIKLVDVDKLENVYWLETKDKVKNTDVRNKKIISDNKEELYNIPEQAKQVINQQTGKRSLI